VIPTEESHLSDPYARPTHRSWDTDTTYIGRLKTVKTNDPPKDDTAHLLRSKVESKSALAFHASETPFWVKADHTYFVEEDADEQANALFMLFTVPTGV
jgi:hypothetical protein